MRYPGPYAQELLVNLLVGAQFGRQDLVQLLNNQAPPMVAAGLPVA